MADDERGQLERAQRGDREAFSTLYEEHAPMAWRVALVVGRDPSVAAAAVVDAFVQVLGTPDRGTEQLVSPGIRLVRAARAGAAAGVPGAPRHRRGDVLLPDGARLGIRTDDADVAVRAFDCLPERWRTVLWLLDVERVPAEDAGTILEMTAQGAVKLAERASAGLHEQFVQAQVRTATKADCQRTAVRLSGYVAGTLSARDEVRVRRHLDRCEGCRTRLDEVDDLVVHLRASVLGLPVAVATVAEHAWHTKATEGAGPLGLRLPSGRPVPAWAERTLTGVTAAMVAVGITAAVMAGGRGGRAIPTVDQLVQPAGAPDGESALGGEPTEGPIDGGQPTHTTSMSRDRGRPAAADPATPRGGAPAPAAPARPSGVAPDPGPSAPPAPNPPTPPEPTPPPSEPPAPSPVAEVLDVVDDITEPLDVCLDGSPLNDLTGCDEPAASEPTLPVLPDLLP
jgi:DNA-directed RNA polymerase specialized sigma24 family protein